MNEQSLTDRFAKGKLPDNLDGFYQGRLLLLLPLTPREHFANFLSNFFLPWKGKCFYHKEKRGDNILPNLIKPLLALSPRKIPLGEYEFGGFHALPFTTSAEKSLDGEEKVLRLNYDLAENPSQARNVVDELVLTEKNDYLGKVFLKEKNQFRLVGFFQLQG